MKQFVCVCFILVGIYSCTYGQRNLDPQFHKINTALYAIDNLYVDTVKSSKLVEDAIIGMLAKLDPHSTYLTAEELKEADEPLQGNFDGIGVQFNMLTDTLYIVEVISGGPSEKVGIRAGDRIIQVDDTLIAGVKMKNTEVMSRLRGPKGTTVNVKILRKNNAGLLDFKIIRDKIPIHSLNAHYMLDAETGYIKLDRFAATSHEEFKTAVAELQTQGMKNLIFDLQSNGGGYLDAGIWIANEFLKQNQLIVYTEGVHQRRNDARARFDGTLSTGRLIILVDENTASASEIVSGAVQDWDRGVIVGRRTFGKGLVQRPIPLPDGSMIRLTTARYYTPTGRSIQTPYESGKLDSYYNEFNTRFLRGEMLSADSIQFSDSLKYSTLVENRTVYGGGGIMPDYFVPMNNDTTGWYYLAAKTSLYREIYNNGTIYKYVTQMIDNNRDKLKKQYPDYVTIGKKFTVSDKIINELLDLYKKDKAEELKEKSYQLTEEQQKELPNAKPLIQFQLKGYLIRELLGENDYYHFLNDSDVYNDALPKAIELINNPTEYNKLLKK
jgi:carboxyl-terminal processing protease